jgi:ribose transport system permease protein
MSSSSDSLLIRLAGLLALCVVLSVLTIREQHEVDYDAGVQLAGQADSISKQGGRAFLIVTPQDVPEQAEFARGIQAVLRVGKLGEATSIHEAKGDARAVRKVLESLNAESTKLDAILTTHEASQWLLLTDEDFVVDFPALGTPPILVPTPYRWPDFLKVQNLFNIADQIAVIAVVGIGMTLVIITAGIDLSVGSLIAISAVSSCKLIEKYGGGVDAGTGFMILSAIAGILIAGVMGVFNGLLITGLRIPPFIVTLSTMLAVSGVAYMLTGGESAYEIPPRFKWLSHGTLGGVPNSVVMLIAFFALAHFVMTRTVWGRRLYAVGGNREAARLSGIRTERVLLAAYVTSALLAGFGGIIMASKLQSGSPMFGQMYELYVIAAVVVGGTSLSGGRGTMLGTLIGALIIAVIRNGMVLLQVESNLQKVVLGLVILAAVGIDQRRGAERS